MVRFLIVFWAGVSMLSSSAIAQENDSVSIELPATVELAMIVAAISDLDRDGQSINRSGSYGEAVEAHFASHVDHPIFQALGDRFNLPRLAGNAADFAMSDDGRIMEIDGSGSIWGDADGDLFRRHLALLEDFAIKSDFQTFYESQSPIYEAAVSNMRAQTDSATMTIWLEANFSARPGPMQIIISPLIGDLNWTTIFKPQTRMWLAPPSSIQEAATVSDYDRVHDSYSVFTELDHSYVNPATALILDKVEAAFKDLELWARPRSPAANYATAELQFNEYMTWTVYLMYASDQLSEDEFDRLKQSFVSFMVEQRGFIAFEAFADEALRLFVENGLTGEETIPLMASWAQEYTATSD